MSNKLRIQALTVDCSDPALLGAFWSKALDWEITEADEIGVVIELRDGTPLESASPEILFLKNPDMKIAKNRLHLDLRPENQEVEVERLIALGASRIEIGQSDEPEATWVVMADPEGNEFCVLRALHKD